MNNMKNRLKNETKWGRLAGSDYENTIKYIKEMYGEEIDYTLGYCKKLTGCNDDIISKARFTILAIKLYPVILDNYYRNGSNALIRELTELCETTNDSHILSCLKVLEEYCSLTNCVSINSGKKIMHAEYTDPKDILFEGNYVAKKINGKACIIDCLGNDKELQIPDTIQNLPVDSINHYAFCGKKINNVIFHSGIETIGNDAFTDNKLSSIIIPSSVRQIGENAFQFNNLTSVSIPGNVICISPYAFQNNRLKSVELGEGITHLDIGAFDDNCLEDITIPNSVKSIAADVFTLNPLKKITLPSDVELDEYGCTEGDLVSAYNRNNKSAGTYIGDIKNYEAGLFSEGDWRFSLDTEIFTGWEINVHKEMENLSIAQEKAIEKIKMSKEGRKLIALQCYFRNPIPKEVWEVMPNDFRDYIKEKIYSEKTCVVFSPKPTGKQPEKTDELEHIILDFDQIIVFYDSFCQQIYNARTGECIS